MPEKQDLSAFEKFFRDSEGMSESDIEQVISAIRDGRVIHANQEIVPSVFGVPLKVTHVTKISRKRTAPDIEI